MYIQNAKKRDAKGPTKGGAGGFQPSGEGKEGKEVGAIPEGEGEEEKSPKC